MARERAGYTLIDIVDRLRRADPGMLIGTYSGHDGQYREPRTARLSPGERDDIKHRFLRRQIDVLVCTDAAAEGLNLQTADLLVNFDLPWNPMKVEQRIGRIDGGPPESVALPQAQRHIPLSTFLTGPMAHSHTGHLPLTRPCWDALDIYCHVSLDLEKQAAAKLKADVPVCKSKNTNHLL